MVIVAQLVEPRIVIPVVEGSSPFIHPTRSMAQFGSAPGLGPGGRRFESYCSDHLKDPLKCGFFISEFYVNKKAPYYFGAFLLSKK